MSTHEYNAAAILNNQLGEIDDLRMALIRMGPGYAHALIDVLYASYHLELTLPADHPAAPVGSACLIPQK